MSKELMRRALAGRTDEYSHMDMHRALATTTNDYVERVAQGSDDYAALLYRLEAAHRMPRASERYSRAA